MKNIILFISFFFFTTISFAETEMNQALLEKIIKEMSLNATGKNGLVQFNFNNVKMYLISDIKYDRMRIIAPIQEYNKLNLQHIDAALVSNFHKSLDARYAVSDGILYSAYIHPLSHLSKSQITSAVHQVANLALSFGGEYSSGVLTYQGKK